MGIYELQAFFLHLVSITKIPCAKLKTISFLSGNITKPKSCNKIVHIELGLDCQSLRKII